MESTNSIKIVLEKFADIFCPSAKSNIEKFLNDDMSYRETHYYEYLMTLIADKYWYNPSYIKYPDHSLKETWIHYTSVKNYVDRTNLCVDFEGVEISHFNDGRWSCHIGSFPFYCPTKYKEDIGFDKITLNQQVDRFNEQYIECTKDEYTEAVRLWKEYFVQQNNKFVQNIFKSIDDDTKYVCSNVCDEINIKR